MRRTRFDCFPDCKKGEKPGPRWIGMFLIVLGVIILVACTPFWFWAAILGLFIAVFGFILWRS